MKNNFQFGHIHMQNDMNKLKEKWVIASVALFSFISALSAKTAINATRTTVHADIAKTNYYTESVNSIPMANLIHLSDDSIVVKGKYHPINPPMSNNEVSDYDQLNDTINKTRIMSRPRADEIKQKNQDLEDEPIDSKNSNNSLLDSLVSNIVAQVKTGKVSTSPSGYSHSVSSKSSPSSAESAVSSTVSSSSINVNSSSRSSNDDDHKSSSRRILSINPNRQSHSQSSTVNNTQKDLKLNLNSTDNLQNRHSTTSVSSDDVQPSSNHRVNRISSQLKSTDAEFLSSMASISRGINSKAITLSAQASTNTSFAISNAQSVINNASQINSLVSRASSQMALMDSVINKFNHYSYEYNTVNADDISKNNDISDMLGELKNRANLGVEPIDSLSSLINSTSSLVTSSRNLAMANANYVRRHTRDAKYDADTALNNFNSGDQEAGFNTQRSAQSLVQVANSYSNVIVGASKAISSANHPFASKIASLGEVVDELGSYAYLAQSTVAEAISPQYTASLSSANASSANESSSAHFDYQNVNLYNHGKMSLINNKPASDEQSASTVNDYTPDHDEPNEHENTTQIRRFRQPRYVYPTNQVNVYSSPDLDVKHLISVYPKVNLQTAPIFKIIGKTLNHHGVTVYEIANDKYIDARVETASLYYPVEDAGHRIKILRGAGVKVHNTVDFSDFGRVLVQGSEVQTIKTISHGSVTRFCLPNNEYLTSNKKFVKIID